MDNLLKMTYILGKNLGQTITMRQLSKEAGVPYTTARRTINSNSSIIITEEKGSSILCKLNTQHPLIRSYLALSERNAADDFCRKNKEISVIKSELPRASRAVVLFGSRASGKERVKSDIDLLVINNDGKKDISFSKQEMLFKLEINSLFMTGKEFKLMLNEEDHNLGHEIMRNHIILQGEEYFWSVALGV